jgi:putative FmdB family regulatory protein
LEEGVPTYVYRCQSCGEVIERRRSFQDPPLTQCEACNGQLRKVLQPVGIIFKGSGFYTTDHRSGQQGEPTAAIEPSSDGEAKSTSAKESSSGSSSSTNGSTETASSSSSSGDSKPAAAAPAATP